MRCGVVRVCGGGGKEEREEEEWWGWGRWVGGEEGRERVCGGGGGHLIGWQNTWEQAPGVPATPSPPLMAGVTPGRVPVYTALKTHPVKPRRAENCNCGKPQFSARLDPMPCRHNNRHVNTDQELHLCTLHLDGHVTVQIHLPLLTATLVLQLEPGIVVVVWAKNVIAAEPVIQHAYTPNELLVLEIIEEEISSHRLHTVPNRIVSTTRSKTTTTRHRDANTPAAHVCRRRARDHDSCSGSDGPTIERDCERHNIELRNWSCEHENPSVLPARDWVCQTIPRPAMLGWQTQHVDGVVSNTRRARNSTKRLID